jgi:hypothetical protein
MRRWLLLLVGLMFVGCTITVTPIAKKPTKHRYKKTVAKKPEKTNSWLIVDSDWLAQYRQLEEQHGNYTLSDDAKVEPAGEGKYKVTHAMMDHFRDLSLTPVATPTPR